MSSRIIYITNPLNLDPMVVNMWVSKTGFYLDHQIKSNSSCMVHFYQKKKKKVHGS